MENSTRRILFYVIGPGAVLFLVILLVVELRAPTPIDTGPSFHGLVRGSVVGFLGGRMEPPFVLIIHHERGMTTSIGSHRVMSVDLERECLNLRAANGSKVHTTIWFRWIAAIHDTNPMLDVDWFDDDKNAIQ